MKDDDDPHEQLIRSLETQVSDLTAQVTQLNSKLVTSYNRVSDLEDSLHECNTLLASEKKKVAELERRVGHHQSLLSSGSLVSQSEIASELSRMMDTVNFEAAQRGQAEEARRNMERDLSELSESLFGEANRMVVEARKEQDKTKRQMKELEKEVRGTEELVGVLQKQLRDATAAAPSIRSEASSSSLIRTRKLSFDSQSYSTFVNLISHIKSLKSASPPPTALPSLPGLLNQPFISRLIKEDSEPTLRLDIAPGLNLLTRRSVLAAIYAGQLSIERVPPSNPRATNTPCSLCGSSLGNASDFAFILPTAIHTSVSSTPINVPQNFVTFPLCSNPPLKETETSQCMRRLRTTCSLFAYIRSAVIDYTYTHSPGPNPVDPEWRSISPSSKGSITSELLPGSPPAVVTKQAPAASQRIPKGLTLTVSSFWDALKSPSPPPPKTAGLRSLVLVEESKSGTTTPLTAIPKRVPASQRRSAIVPPERRESLRVPVSPGGTAAMRRGEIGLDPAKIALPPSRSPTPDELTIHHQTNREDVEHAGKNNESLERTATLNTPAPPPIPVRSARRGVSQLGLELNGESQSQSSESETLTREKMGDSSRIHDDSVLTTVNVTLSGVPHTQGGTRAGSLTPSGSESDSQGIASPTMLSPRCVNNPELDDTSRDESWEHRTFREIVRLREEMFFARVGLTTD